MVDVAVQARAAVKELLDVLRVQLVVCVDDLYVQSRSLEDVQAVAMDFSELEMRELLQCPDVPFPDDRDVRRTAIRSVWERFDVPKQISIANTILTAAEVKHPDRPNDFSAATALSDLIGEDRLLTIPPSRWEEQWPSIKAKAATQNILLLFDQDLSGDGGSETGGITLAKNVLADADVGGSLMCGLLTHTATIDTQHEQWETMAQQYDLDQDRFIVVAKRWLDKDPLGFARMLKLVALGPDCRRMKMLAQTLLQEAISDAADDVGKIRIDDFDHMVFKASRTEGLWEPDMLFRIFGIYHRTATRRRAYENEDLKAIASRLRSVSHISTHSDTAPSSNSWKIQQQEMYDDANYINSMRLPIEVGDIFKKTGTESTKYYILLGQPCDLMVRQCGKRHPEITDVLLAEIGESEHAGEYLCHLSYFGEDPLKKYYVKLRRTHTVDPCVLDLCVYNDDGIARMTIGSECPNNVVPAWKERFVVLQKLAKSIVQRYDQFGQNMEMNAQLRNYLRTTTPTEFPVQTANSRLFKATLDLTPGQQAINFNCCRVMRLHQARAAALALKYAECFSRPAFDRDLGLS